MVAGIKSEGWPRSNRNAWPPCVGIRTAAEGVVKMWPVSRAVNSVKNNGVELLDRIDDPAVPPPSDAPPGQNPV